MEEKTVNTEFKPLNLREIVFKLKPKAARFIPGFVYNYLNKVLHIDEINSFALEHINDDGPTFIKELVKYFDFSVKFEGQGFDEFKKNIDSSYMVVSNHPFGGPEAGILFNELIGIYPDMKLLAQSFMKIIKPFRECCVFNKSEVRSLLEHVNKKQSLLIYPAGYCSRELSNKEIFDYDWKASFIKIAKKNNMPITVIYTDGHLSKRMLNWTKIRKIFHIKTSIETIYLVDEIFRMKGSTLRMVVGQTISPDTFDNSADATTWAARLRQYCFNLRDNPDATFNPKVELTLPQK